jgi:hypothetical protein
MGLTLSSIDKETISNLQQLICSTYLSQIPITTTSETLTALENLENDIIESINNVSIPVEVLVFNNNLKEQTTLSPVSQYTSREINGININYQYMYNVTINSRNISGHLMGAWVITFDQQNNMWSINTLLQTKIDPSTNNGTGILVLINSYTCPAKNSGSQNNQNGMTVQFRSTHRGKQLPPQLQKFIRLFVTSSKGQNGRLLYQENGQIYEVIPLNRRSYHVLRNGQPFFNGVIY